MHAAEPGLNRRLRTYLATLVAGAIGAAALIGWLRAPASEVSRSVAVTFVQPGAPPTIVERDLLDPIEQRLAGMPGIARLEAVARDGIGRLVVSPDRGLETVAEQSVRLVVGSSKVAAGARISAAHQLDGAMADRPLAFREGVARGAFNGRRAAVAIMVGLMVVLIAGMATRSTTATLAVLAAVAISSAVATGVALSAGALPPDVVVAVTLALPMLIADASTLHASIVRSAYEGDSRWQAVVRGIGGSGPSVGVSVILCVVLLVPTVVVTRAQPAAEGVAIALLTAVAASCVVTPLVVAAVSALPQPTRARRRNSFTCVQSRVDGAVEAIVERYHELLAALLGRRRLSSALALGALVIAAGILRTVRGADPIPTDEPHRIVVQLTTPLGSPPAQTTSLAHTVSYIARAHPEVATTEVTVGDWSGAAHYASVDVTLTNEASREVSARALARSLRDEMDELAGAEYSVDVRGARPDPEVEVIVSGPDARTLFGVAQHVAVELRAVSRVVDVTLSARALGEADGPSQLEHIDGQRVMRVRANVDGASRPAAREVAHELRARLTTLPLPPGYKLALDGTLEQDRRSRQRAAVGIIIAVVVTWLVLAAHSRSASIASVIALSLFVPAGTSAAVIRASGRDLDWWALVVITISAVTLFKYALPLVRAAGDHHLRAMPSRVALIEVARASFRSILAPSAASCLAAFVTMLALRPGTLSDALGWSAMGGTVAAAIGALILLPMWYQWTVESLDAIRSRAPLLRGASTRSGETSSEHGVGAVP